MKKLDWVAPFVAKPPPANSTTDTDTQRLREGSKKTIEFVDMLIHRGGGGHRGPIQGVRSA